MANYRKRAEKRVTIAGTIPQSLRDALVHIAARESRIQGVDVKLSWVLEDLLSNHPSILRALRERDEEPIDIGFAMGDAVDET